MDFQDPVVVVLITAGALFLSQLIFKMVVAGSLGRWYQGQGVALRWLRDKEFAGKVNDILNPPPPPPVKPNPDPILVLTLLQREGRLLDFLLEDIQAYPNEQIGAAVRDIQRNCQKALKEHVTLTPVIAGKQEGDKVEVAKGFDPSAIRLTGNVTGQPPFRGTLQHHGWRVTETKLQRPPEGQDGFVVHPAEVELT